MTETLRTLIAEEAAKEMGFDTVEQFKNAVKRGDLPQPVIRGRPRRWSEIQLQEGLAGRRDAAIAPTGDTHDEIMEDVDEVLDALRY